MSRIDAAVIEYRQSMNRAQNAARKIFKTATVADYPAVANLDSEAEEMVLLIHNLKVPLAMKRRRQLVKAAPDPRDLNDAIRQVNEWILYKITPDLSNWSDKWLLKVQTVAEALTTLNDMNPIYEVQFPGKTTDLKADTAARVLPILGAELSKREETTA